MCIIFKNLLYLLEQNNTEITFYKKQGNMYQIHPIILVTGQNFQATIGIS
jgi:hypothetical protein